MKLLNFLKRGKKAENADKNLTGAMQSFLSTRSWPEAKYVVETHPELLTDDADKQFTQWIKQQDDPEVRRIIDKHRRLLIRCRMEGIDSVFGLAPSSKPVEIDPELLVQLNSISSPFELIQLLAEHPELRPIVNQMMQQTAQPPSSFATTQTREDEFQTELSHSSSQLQQILIKLAQPITDPRQQLERLRLFEQALKFVDRQRSPKIWAMLHNDYGVTLRQTPSSNRADNIEKAISNYYAALEVYTREEYPVEWAQTQNNLGNAYGDRIFGDQAENIELAITAFQTCLEVRTRTAFPEQWAKTQNNLGNAYNIRLRGDRADNIERAIGFYTLALEVYTQGKNPDDWAMTQHNLGNACFHRMRGDHEENIEKAIVAYSAALKIYTRYKYPADWAMDQLSLGNAYSERIRGNRKENHESAICFYTNALNIYTRDGFPAEWAKVQSNLGLAYSDDVWNNRSDILEHATIACNAALEVYTQTNFPVEWARTLSCLGVVYMKRLEGERTNNLERALNAFNSALGIYTQENYPDNWAEIHNHLGVIFLSRVEGRRSENQEKAIQAFHSALEVYTQEKYLFDWARTQINLGTVYLHRIFGARSENLEKAFSSFSAAGSVITREKFPADWATLQNNFGAVLSDRTMGDQAENIEQAIIACTSALDILSPIEFPQQWGMAQTNFGTAYSKRILGDQADNQEKAIAAYNAALDVLNKKRFPMEWASIQGNLGKVFFERVQGDPSENLEQAITFLSSALSIWTKENFPIDWTMAQNNLCAAYLKRIQGDRAKNIEQSIIAGNAAKEICTSENMPIELVTILTNLGNAYGNRLFGDQSENFRLAANAYRSAVDIATEMGLQDDERRASCNLGYLYHDMGEFSLAYSALKTAISALEAMRINYISEGSKTNLAEQNAELYAVMVDICLRLQYRQEALEWAEASKGRLLLDQISTGGFPVPSSFLHHPLIEVESGLVSEIRQLENSVRRNQDNPQRQHYVTLQTQKRKALDGVWNELQPMMPEYVALRRGDPIKYPHLIEMMEKITVNAALVEFYCLSDKVIIFILQAGCKDPAVFQVPLSQNQLLHCVQTYWREIVEFPQHGDIGQRWQEIAGPLLKDIIPYLQGVELVYLVPHGLLHYLPLHALRVDGGFFIDYFPIAYAPSAAVLDRITRRHLTNDVGGEFKPLVIGNPTLDLNYAESEAKQVGQIFNVQPLLGKNATKAVALSGFIGKDLIHMACHGFFHPTHPLQSGIILADGERLSAYEIMELTLQCDVVTLSACDTGLSEISSGDELTGLTRALLYAGTSSALVSLWSVNDASTGQLMADFYRRLFKNKGQKIKAKVTALQEAIIQIKESKKHPYYWAPFVLVGDWQ